MARGAEGAMMPFSEIFAYRVIRAAFARADMAGSRAVREMAQHAGR